MAFLPSQAFRPILRLTRSALQCRNRKMQTVIFYRQASSMSGQNQDAAKDLVPSSHAKAILEKEFPDHYRDGQFVSRMSYVEFIDEALAKSKELGLHKDVEFYKELLRIFPPGKFFPTSSFAPYNCHASQQQAVIRLIFQMQMNLLAPDKDFEKLIVAAFSVKSDVWLLIARANYWTMKFRNLDENPLPQKLPKEPHELAKLAIARMMPDHGAIITVNNSSSVPDSVDKTWIVSTQSPDQQAIIDRLDDKATLYIEDGGLSFVGSQYLSYFVLKYYVDEAVVESKKERLPEYNFNTLKMSFFGKPIKEKLSCLEDKHYADGSYTLAICATGTSSQDSLLSWLKILQRRNPKLSKLNVVFKMSRPSPEIIEYGKSYEEQRDRAEASNSKDQKEAFG